MFRMSHILKVALLSGLMLGAGTSAFAQTSSLNSQQAMAALAAMQAYAKNDGSNPSITVIDSEGNTVLLLAGDNSSPHNLGLSQRKAYTSNMFKMPSIEWRDKTMPGQPDAAERDMPNVIPLGGGYPIMVGNEVIGAVGVSGTRGGQEGDTAAAKAAAEAAAALAQRLQAQN
jgi:uncharacterized protein GlcG (DUF336 family)